VAPREAKLANESNGARPRSPKQIGEVVGLAGLFSDKLVALTSHTALQLGPIVKLPIEHPGTNWCASSDNADYSAL